MIFVRPAIISDKINTIDLERNLRVKRKKQGQKGRPQQMRNPAADVTDEKTNKFSEELWALSEVTTE